MIDIDWTLQVPVITLDLGPFTVSDAMFDAIGIDLIELTKSIDPPLVVVDLTPTHHLNSRAIALLVQAWRDFKGRNGRIAFCGMNPYTREVIRTLQLDRHWEVYTTRDDAFLAIHPPFSKSK